MTEDDLTDEQIDAGNRAIMKAVGERLRDTSGRSLSRSTTPEEGR